MKRIQVAGPGCRRCAALYESVKAVVREEGIEAVVEKLSDTMEMMRLGILSTPALVVDGKVRSAGRVPGRDEIRRLIV